VVEGLKSIIEKRVNSLGTAEPTIVTQSYGGEPHIVVQIPTLNLENEGLNDVQKSQRNAEFIQKAKSVIGNVVQLEFKEKKTTITDADKTERKKLAETFLKELTIGKFSFEIVAQKFKANHENISYFSGSGTKSEIPSEVQSVSFLAQKGPSSDFVIEETTGGASLSFDAKGKSVLTEGNKGYLVYKVTAVTQREIEKTTGTGAKAKKEIVKEPAYAYQALWISQQPSEWTIAKTASGQELDERYLQNANVSLNQVMQPQVELNFNSEGAKIFGELTGRLIGKQIAIFVGGEMLTAPTVNSVIPNGKAVITGNYSTEEAKALANNINTGIVPAPIYLTSERTIDAKI
jgi:preprotein translocase subunit SecD